LLISIFVVPPSKAERGQRFCSSECYGDYNREYDERECKNCGDSFYPRAWNVKKGGGEYCSKECVHEKEEVELKCEQCDSSFWVKPHKDDQMFCSKECYNLSIKSRVTRECMECGEEFSVAKCRVESGWGHYCSNNCQYQNWSGEDSPAWEGGAVPYYGSNWCRMRRVVRNRDCFRCRKCGMHEDECDTELHVHHIVPLREFDEPEEANTPSNLVTVCPSCHGEVEGDVEAGRALL